MLVVHNNQHPEPLFKPQLMVRRVPLHVHPYNKSMPIYNEIRPGTKICVLFMTQKLALKTLDIQICIAYQHLILRVLQTCMVLNLYRTKSSGL
jgi:hypothetical protein